MENKINIAELLKDCPKGMELNCTMYENVEFDHVEPNSELLYSIHCLIKTNGEYNTLVFTRNGCNDRHPNSKCVIFPKGKTTWEGFQRPFKDGDIVFISNEYSDTTFTYVAIFEEMQGDEIFMYCAYNYEDNAFYTEDFSLDVYNTRFATEEEKQKLFDAIKANGYKWNAETKTLKKLIEPRFKVGDRIKAICNNNQYDIKELTDTHYTLVEVEYKFKYTEPISEDKKWELVPNKFDINTLKPFDKVLVRNTNKSHWCGQFYMSYDENEKYLFECTYACWRQCIPYEGNEHLLGTTDDCDDFYKNW